MIDPWAPTTRELELIATMTRARLPLARVAAEIGCSEQFLRLWFARLASAPQIDPPKADPPAAVEDEGSVLRRVVFKNEL